MWRHHFPKLKITNFEVIEEHVVLQRLSSTRLFVLLKKTFEFPSLCVAWHWNEKPHRPRSWVCVTNIYYISDSWVNLLNLFVIAWQYKPAVRLFGAFLLCAARSFFVTPMQEQGAVTSSKHTSGVPQSHSSFPSRIPFPQALLKGYNKKQWFSYSM